MAKKVIIRQRPRPPQPQPVEPSTVAANGRSAEPPPPQAEYRTGYGKPPVEHRFKPGKSGNPKGRPRGRKNVTTILDDLLFETATVTERGRERKMPMIEVALRKLRQRGLEGDLKSLHALITLALKLNPPPSSSSDGEEIEPDRKLSATDRAILDMYADEVRTGDAADQEGGEI